jgi:hypothetical protein
MKIQKQTEEASKQGDEKNILARGEYFADSVHQLPKCRVQVR